MSKAALIFFSILLVCCTANQGIVVKTLPFEIQELVVTPADLPGSKIIEVTFQVKNLPSHIALDSLYFRGKSSKISSFYSNKFVASIIFPSKKDVILSNNPVDERNNPIPDLLEKNPISIKADEALLVFKNRGKTNYFILQNSFQDIE